MNKYRLIYWLLVIGAISYSNIDIFISDSQYKDVYHCDISDSFILKLKFALSLIVPVLTSFLLRKYCKVDANDNILLFSYLIFCYLVSVVTIKSQKAVFICDIEWYVYGSIGMFVTLFFYYIQSLPYTTIKEEDELDVFD